MGQKRLLVILLTTVTILVGACSGISVLSGPDRRDLYSDSFTQKINAIKETYRQGEHDVALQQLKLMLEETLLPTERASRRNLIGVILFAKGNYEQAIFNFDQALSTSRLDENLTSQIYLNLASCYYKLGFMEKAFSTLTQGKAETLTKGEAQKLYKLKYKVAKEMGKDDESLNSLFNLLSNKNKLSELKSEPYFEHLLGLFFRQDQSKKYRILESFEATKALVVGYIGYLEAEKLYYKGEKDEAKDLLEWVEKYFGEQNEIEMLAKNFFFRVENYAKINTHNIGIILPLSGRKDSFGQRALLGIDYAVQEFNTRLPEQQRFKVYIKDSKGSGAVGAHSVTELIEKNFVSVIIGGLFSSEATNEYLEAKKEVFSLSHFPRFICPKSKKITYYWKYPAQSNLKWNSFLAIRCWIALANVPLLSFLILRVEKLT